MVYCYRYNKVRHFPSCLILGPELNLASSVLTESEEVDASTKMQQHLLQWATSWFDISLVLTPHIPAMLLPYHVFQDEWSQDLRFILVPQDVQRFDPARLGRETFIFAQRPLTHIDSSMERLRSYPAFLRIKVALTVQVTTSPQSLAVKQAYNT